MNKKIVADELVKLAKAVQKLADRKALEQYIDKKYPQKELKDVAKAYADSFIFENIRGVSEKECYAMRDLDFKGSYVDANTFIKQAEIIGEYNHFTVAVANDLVKIIGKTSGSLVKFRLARESSVAVYIKSPKNKSVDLNELEESVDADESSISGDEIRLWWD